MMNQYAAMINATEYPPKFKHKVIFDTFSTLPPSKAMLLVNDHDPLPLRYQFEAMHANEFTWEYVQEGPDVFQVKIGKI